MKENIAVVHVFFEKQGFLKKTRGKIYDELVKKGWGIKFETSYVNKVHRNMIFWWLLV